MICKSLTSLSICRIVVLGLAAVACTPTYDWREIVVEGDLNVWMPCKPQKISRSARLGSQTWPMTVYGCEAGGQNWAVSSVDVTDPVQAHAVLLALNEALAANLVTRLPRAQLPAAPGLAQSQEVLRYDLRGQRPDGSQVGVEIWSFAHGLRVYQASLMQGLPNAGGRDAQDARRTFFESLKFGR